MFGHIDHEERRLISLGVTAGLLGGLLAWQRRQAFPGQPTAVTQDASVIPEPYDPPPWLFNAHLQTIVSPLRSRRGVGFRRQRLATPDGDWLLLDYAEVAGAGWADLGPRAPIVLVLHGLEGHARRGYACEAYRQLARRGIRSLGLNNRSCGGELNRTPFMYHAGSTQDAAFVLAHLRRRWPKAPIGVIGFSLGGNQILKLLGERGDAAEALCDAAVAISPPFDLSAATWVMTRGSGRHYMPRLLQELQAKAAAQADLLGDKVDMARVAACRTIREFDEAFTAPLYGFLSANDYYEQTGAGRFLPDIRVPTLIIRAYNDPFFSRDVPEDVIAVNPYLFSAVTKHGGHVGFAEGRWPWALRFWSERQAARFLAAWLRDRDAADS